MSRKRLVGLAASGAAGVLVAGAAAYAAWTVNGSGPGSASATSAVALSLAAGSP